MSVEVPKPEAAAAHLRAGRRLAGTQVTGIPVAATIREPHDAPRAARLPRGVFV